MIRRHFLQVSLTAAAALVAACAPAAAPTNTAAPAPAKPTEAPKPAAAAPTTAPAAAPTTAPAAATSAPAAAAPAKAATGTKIVFLSDIGGPHIKLRDDWAKKYADQSGVQVEHQPAVDGYTNKLLTMFAGGVAPDVFRYLQEAVPIVAAIDKKMLARLDDFAKRDNYDLADFLPQAVELYRWKGPLYALPRDYGNQNIYYNQSLFDAAGLGKLPTDWTDTTFTYDKLLEMATKLTKSEGARTTQFGIAVNRNWRPWNSFVYSNGGKLVNTDADGIATGIAMDQPPALEALQFLQDLIYKHKVAPTPESETETNPRELFTTGRLGMIIDNPSSVQFYRAIKAFQWDVAPFPIGKAQKRGVGGGGTGWAVADASKQGEAAWGFLKFISSKDAELDEVRIGGTTPARKSVVDSKEFLDPSQPPKNARGFAQGQGYVVRDPIHARWVEIQGEVLNKELDNLWGNKAPAAQVVQNMKQKADPLFKS